MPVFENLKKVKITPSYCECIGNCTLHILYCTLYCSTVTGSVFMRRFTLFMYLYIMFFFSCNLSRYPVIVLQVVRSWVTRDISLYIFFRWKCLLFMLLTGVVLVETSSFFSLVSGLGSARLGLPASGFQLKYRTQKKIIIIECKLKVTISCVTFYAVYTIFRNINPQNSISLACKI